MKKAVLIIIICLGFMSSEIYAEKIHLHSGEIIEGEIIEETDKYIKINIEGACLTYYLDKIKGIEKTVRNEDGSVSTSYRGVSFSPEEEKSLDNFKDSLEKNLRKSSESYNTSCADYANKLDECEPYECEFIHPFTGETMKKKIIGLKNNKCHYVEQMPNGGKMECYYSLESRKAVAQYTRNLASAESFGTKANLSLDDVEVKYTINGKKVKNPAQECLDNGECVITGY